jgi:hypothetical protein
LTLNEYEICLPFSLQNSFEELYTEKNV